MLDSHQEVMFVSMQVKPHHFLVDANGKPEAVVLSLTDYNRLLRLLEDRADAAVLEQAIRTSPGTISHDELLGRLKQHRLL